MFVGAALSQKLPASLETFCFYIGYLGLYGGLFWGYLSGALYTRQFVAGYARVVP